ncbi:hypothetical protein TMRO357_01742 [Alteriqipengyuania sp. 357]
MSDIKIVAINVEDLAGLPFEAGLGGFQQNAPTAGIPCLIALPLIPIFE